MFWGLILEPQRRYSQVVKKPFRITMAALDVNSSDEEPTQVIVTFQKRNFLMCTLQKGSILNEHLDLCFEAGDQISFAANGSCHVHLTGYLMDTEEGDELLLDMEEDGEKSDLPDKPLGMKRTAENKNLPPTKKSKLLEMLEDVNSDSEDDSDFTLSNTLATESSDEDESGSGEEEEVDEEEEDEDNENEVEEEEDGDEDVEEEEDDDDEDDDDDDEDEEEEVKEEIKIETKSPKKQLQDIKQLQKDIKKTNNITESVKGNRKKRTEKAEKAKTQENASPLKNGSPVKKKTVEGGVTVEELKVGNGPVAKPGKFVQVYYEGRLKSNNKLFDSATKGSGFEFRLGRQEVIKGWDVGLAGMKVGGKRRIICPPNMAYGAKGSPPAIPPNSALVFDVELKKVK